MSAVELPSAGVPAPPDAPQNVPGPGPTPPPGPDEPLLPAEPAERPSEGDGDEQEEDEG
jgi:hypothetical protein